MIPQWIQAGLWGLLSGMALLLGALAGYFLPVPRRLTAGIMAFGSGVLFSALSFELVDEAYRTGGFKATALGFLIGASLFTAVNYYLNHRGAKHRKRSGGQQVSEAQHAGSGLCIAMGALLDGIPESMVIGLSLLKGPGVSMVAVVAVFLSNLPEGLASAAGMKQAGRSPRYVFGLWGGIALVSGIAACVGYSFFQQASNDTIALINALAAGAILAMLMDTMVPEAFEEAHEFAGLITVIGFLVAFYMSKLDQP